MNTLDAICGIIFLLLGLWKAKELIDIWAPHLANKIIAWIEMDKNG